MPGKRELEYSAKYIEKMEGLMNKIRQAESIITRATIILAMLQDEFDTILSRTDLSNNQII
jgi:hypothetical protein